MCAGDGDIWYVLMVLMVCGRRVFQEVNASELGGSSSEAAATSLVAVGQKEKG